MAKVPNLPEKEFKRLLKMVPFIAVDAVIVNEKGEFLLEKRTYPPYTGRWHVPGGFMAYGERLAETAKRKALQETGLKISIERFTGIYDDPKLDPRGRIIVAAFRAKHTGGKLKPEGLKWFKNIPKNIMPFQRYELRDAGFK